MAIRVLHKIDIPSVLWDETKFSLESQLPVVVPLFINKKIVITTAERLFSVPRHFKNFSQNQFQQRWYGIENLNKDGSLHEQTYPK